MSTYSWKRFWCRRGGEYSLSDSGYLYDPDSEYGETINPDVFSFERITVSPSLVLLGEPGIGKSTAIRQEFESLQASLGEAGDHALFVDLGEYGDEGRLIADCFESEVIERWRSGTGTLHLFLDSLDECRLEIRNVARVIAAQLRRYSALVDRLRLRIACRVTEWPSSLEQKLVDLWGDEHVGVFELAPLRRRDVEAAATTEDLDSEAFLRQIAERECESLAVNPVSLGLLLRIAATGGALPASRVEIFQQGCSLLASEVSATRREAGHLGSLSPSRRMDIASAVAAATVFCGRPIINTTATRLDAAPNELAASELMEISDVTEDELNEVLGSALFSGRGANRCGFAHSTYAEFLAARYVHQSNTDLRQRVSLFCYAGDRSSRVVPQLGTTAAWLASMDIDFFAELTDRDPQVLLRCDAALSSHERTASLVASLLEQLDRGEIDDSDWDLRPHYRKLQHDSLFTQLQPIVADRARNTVVRRFAIDVAEANGVVELLDDLVRIALDSSESYQIRDQAAHAVAEIGNDDVRARLRPLLSASADEDPDDQLRGSAMRALWPASLTAEELFDHVTEPHNSSFGGAYSFFLSQELLPTLEASDLVAAIRWCSRQSRRLRSADRLAMFMEQIVSCALEHLASEDVLSELTRFVISRIHRHEPWRGTEEPTEEQRRLLAHRVVQEIEGVEDIGFRFAFGETPLLLREDLVWALRQAEGDPTTAEKWARICGHLYRCSGGVGVSEVVEATQRSEHLRDEFGWLLTTVEIGSDEADELRRRHEEHEARTREWRSEPPALDPPPHERVAHWLAQAASGNPDAWWVLNQELQLEPTSTHYRLDLEPDLRQFPGWQSADDDCRGRLIELARDYILSRTSEPNEWLGTGTIHFPDFAGYRALSLLLVEDPEFVDGLSSDRWENWAPVVLGFPHSSGVGDSAEEIRNRLVELASTEAPSVVADALNTLIDHENDRSDHLFALRLVENCVTPEICAALEVKARDPSLKATCVGEILQFLIRHECHEGRHLATTILEESSCDALVLNAATALWVCADDCGWDVLWNRFQVNPTLGMEVIERVATREFRAPNSLLGLSVAQLADLYIWLGTQYPHSEDPKVEGAHHVGTRESVQDYREGALRILQARGTWTACAEIERIARAFPEQEYLRWAYRNARMQTLRETWVPLDVRELFELTSRRGSRLIQSADELLELLVECLWEIQQEITGETPAIRDLWDRSSPPERWRPIDENDFSDYIVRSLRRRLESHGIIALREVEIRRGRAGIPGERTDIHVTGVVQSGDGTFESVRVIIESKGCWHSELLTAMETQLVDRYLHENECQHGLYLVGWFNCDQWDADDHRRSRAPSWSVDHAREQFEGQAHTLSNADRSIRSVVLRCGLS